MCSTTYVVKRIVVDAIDARASGGGANPISALQAPVADKRV
jgi:hypothetical protein